MSNKASNMPVVKRSTNQVPISGVVQDLSPEEEGKPLDRPIYYIAHKTKELETAPYTSENLGRICRQVIKCGSEYVVKQGRIVKLGITDGIWEDKEIQMNDTDPVIYYGGNDNG